MGGVHMNIKLTQKERMLLQDQKSHEELCVKKYTEAANKAQDPQLKQIFQKIGQHEQQHLNTINQILGGQVPQMNSGQQSQSQGQGNQQSGSQSNQGMKMMQSGGTPASYNQKDKELCDDLLMTEKYVSGTYDITIFECVDCNLRDTLNHIQKEEQQHGEEIFNYMYNQGMYTPQ